MNGILDFTAVFFGGGGGGVRRKEAQASMVAWNDSESLGSWERSRSWIDFFALSFSVDKAM